MFPTLHKLLGEIARALRTTETKIVLVDGDFNAAFAQVGILRKNVVFIGLPLFAVLNGQERVALLAHELAHGVNRDLARSYLLGTAIESLITWYRIIIPDTIFDDDNLLFALLSLPLNLLRLALAKLTYAYLSLLLHLMWRESQRAEYLADYLGASVAGTESMVAMMEKLHLQATYDEIVRSVALNGGKQDFFRAIKKSASAMKEYGIKPGLQEDNMLMSRLDVTHPPTNYRQQFLSARPAMAPKVILTPEEHEQMDKELTVLEPAIQEQIVDRYISSIYYG